MQQPQIYLRLNFEGLLNSFDFKFSGCKDEDHFQSHNFLPPMILIFSSSRWFVNRCVHTYNGMFYFHELYQRCYSKIGSAKNNFHVSLLLLLILLNIRFLGGKYLLILWLMQLMKDSNFLFATMLDDNMIKINNPLLIT